MSEPLWRVARCTDCKESRASIVIVRWGFNKDGTLSIYGVCRWCYRQMDITHTRTEQLGDEREMFNEWRRSGSDEADDFSLWEEDILPDGDLMEDDQEEGGSDGGEEDG